MARKRRWLLLFSGSICAGLCLFLLGLFVPVPSSAHLAAAPPQQPASLVTVHTGHGEMKVYDPQQLKQASGVWRKTAIQQHTFTATAPARHSEAQASPWGGLPVVPLLAGFFPPGCCLLLYAVSRQRRREVREDQRFSHQRSEQ
jgi:hypothetical protein